MKSGNKFLTDAEKLRHWLDFSIPRGEYGKMKRHLAQECLVSDNTFKNWLYGQSRMPESAKRDINRVTMEYSGKEIFTIAKPAGISDGVCGESACEAIDQ